MKGKGSDILLPTFMKSGSEEWDECQTDKMRNNKGRSQSPLDDNIETIY